MKSDSTLPRLGRKQTSLFKRITKSVVLLIIGLFLVTGVIIGSVVYKSSKSTMVNQLHEMSTAYTMVVEKELGILHETLNSIAEYAAILEGPLNGPSVNTMLNLKKSEYGFYTIYGIDKLGQTSTEGVTVGDRDYFLSAIKGNFFASSPFLKSDNSVGITIAVPAYRNKEIAGIVSAGIPYDYFSGFVNYKIGKTGESYIIDKTGTIVGHTNTDLVMNFYNSINDVKNNPSMQHQADAISSFLKGDYSLREYQTSDGITKTAVANLIPGTDGWILVTTMDNSELNRNALMVLIILGIIVVAGLIIGIISAMFLAKGISNPIKEINSRLSLLSDGDLSSEVTSVQTGDEIQSLSEGLGDTIMQLRMYISEISHVTGSMAAYNLDTTVSGEFKGEFMPIKNSLNQILELMNNSFGEIGEASHQVNIGAEQVSNTAQALSQGATEQASSIQELSATISLISEQVKHNADSAVSANTKTNDVGNKITESNLQMQQLISAMDEIRNSSDEISKIIKTIEDIAFQTNILALNAAVEAARAGQAGKGFAVVADEVRNLASKSAEAAKNTNSLIKNSIDAVKKGTDIAGATANYLEQVVVAAKDVITTVDQISLASNEQASSISQVTQGIDQISAVVQTNSATAEQSAAASEELSGQATMLKSLTDRFKLNRNRNNQGNYSDMSSKKTNIKLDYDYTDGKY